MTGVVPFQKGFVLPARDYRRTHVKTPSVIHTGLDGVVHELVGQWRRNPLTVQSLGKKALRIRKTAKELRGLSDGKLNRFLRSSAALFRKKEGASDDVLQGALAALAVAAERTLGMFPHGVQLMGALALHGGYLIEMATGEGKSLTGCLAGVLAGWTGRPCHILTVNDYLAERDAEELRPFYRFCGLTTGAVSGGMQPEQRRKAYEQSVVYTTSKELLADFLRDRLKLGAMHHPSRRLIRQMLRPGLRMRDGLVMRGLDTAIVDEADSVLIDEAVTPLIISATRENRLMSEAAAVALNIAESLTIDEDYRVDLKYKEIRLTPKGRDRIEEETGSMPGIWKGVSRGVELVKQALAAKAFFHRDRQYVVDSDKIVIVDEYTGRLMPDRNWSNGLHQIVEAMEGVDGTDPTETLASLSFQRFFRLFRKLSGMTGTARETVSEFWNIYRLPVMAIPTHRPGRRKALSDAVFADADAKWQAIADEAEKVHGTGQPVLIGTRNVSASQRLAKLLEGREIPFNLLNAVRHREEARIVAEAGKTGKVTIATNMAGRGTDIKLGRGTKELGGLHVIASERHDSRRIDRQLFGRCARQGEPGSTRAFVCMDDEVVKRFISNWAACLLKGAVRHRVPGSKFFARRAVFRAQRAAQRLAFRQRKGVLKMDTWLEEALFFGGRGAGF